MTQSAAPPEVSEQKPKKNREPQGEKKGKPAKVEAPEDSVGLRAVACAIAILCIATACLYVESQPMLIFLYLWGALTGSYVSYVFRHQKTFWLTFITSAGLLIVLGNFGEEVISQFNAGKINALIPFIHVLTGLQALHTFDLRAKSDINVSALIGLGLFACTAVLARDMLFAYITLAYITLAASLLYYEAVSRTAAAGAVGTSSERAEMNAFKETAVKKRVSTGNAFLSLALLPLVSVLVFLTLPRVDSLFDLIVANARHAQNGESLNFNWVKSPNGFSILATMPGMGTLKIDKNGIENDTEAGAVAGVHGTAGGDTRAGRYEVGPDGAGIAPAGSPTDGREKGSTAKAGKHGTPGSGGSSNSEKAGSKDGKNGKGVKGKPGKSGKADGKPDKANGKPGNADSKTGKSDGKSGGDENKSAASPPPPSDEKTPEQEDQSLVFRNKDTIEHEDDLIMRVMSSRETYFRRNCFDKYDGHKWTFTGLGKVSKCVKRNTPYQELAGVPSLFVEPSVHSAQLTQEYTIEDSIGHLIPVAAIPQQLTYPKDPVEVDQFGCLHAAEPIKSGVTYRVVSQVPEYDVDEMRRAASAKNSDTKGSENYLQLPTDLNPQIKKLATSVAGNDGNTFAKAERICNFLRRNYKYSSDLGDEDAREEIASRFLFRKKQGACGPFSTAFVVMCRSIGIPARCVGGFTPGDFNASTGIHEVRNKHGHAWGEAYIPGYDWVPFDATPTGLLPKPTPEDNSLMGSLQKTMTKLQDQFTNQTPAPPPLPPAPPEEVKRQAGNPPKSGEKPGADKPGEDKPGKNTGKDSKSSSGKSNGKDKNGKLDKADSKGATDNASTSEQKPPSKPADGQKEAAAPSPFKFNWRDWHEVVLLIIIIPAVIVLFQAIRTAIQQARAAYKHRTVEKPKASTLLYLKVVDDLARVKIHRLPTDTPEDLMARFSDSSLHQSGVHFHPELEPLCKRFMDLYIADRFGCDDATELRAGQMKKIGEQIHTIVRAKHHDN